MSQIPNYTEAPSAPQTEQKIRTLEKKDSILGGLARSIFGGGSPSEAQLQSLTPANRKKLESLFAQEIAFAFSGSSGGTSGGSSGGGFAQSPFNPFGPTEGNRFQGSIDAVNRTLSKTSENIKETFKPASTVVGETLGNATKFCANPLGTIALIPGSLKNVIDRNFPEFGADLDNTFQKFNIDQLLNAPSALLGSIRNLITAADALLSIPIMIISDLYNGLMDFILDLADAIDQLLASFIKNIFESFLDELVPGLFDFLQELAALAGEIAAISSIFLGSNQIAAFALNVQNYANALTSFISNPLNTLFAYAPPQISEALYLLRNPQQLINNILPPELSQLFAPIAQITGFGFNGNMGFGFASVLQGLEGGVISSVLTNFAGQYPILTSLLGLINTTAPPPNASVPPTVTPSPVAPNNQNIKVGKQGVPVLQNEPEQVIPENSPYNQESLFAMSAGNRALSQLGIDPNNPRATFTDINAVRAQAAREQAGGFAGSQFNDIRGGPNRVPESENI